MRILIVEDEMMVAMMLEDMASDLGHAVVQVAATIESALVAIERVDMDLAILDLNLNGEQTFGVAERLRARGIPFLFATGYGTAALQAGFKDTLTLQKPFVIDQLRDAIASVRRTEAA